MTPTFVTSPNADVIFAPALGLNRQVRLRADWRYGDDDPMQWPQNYSQYHSHLSAIPALPTDSMSPLNIMWWTPSLRDMVGTDNNKTSSQVAFGRLSTDKARAFRTCVDALMISEL